ncbi:MAG TPA: ABC transporter permease [Bryobacteraceae bacterium]|jgi:predicted permease|nr:ABC transporter permease [Bryobacteraceae bacterium]
MDTLRQDLQFALRVLRKKPGFTLVASLTLALGIAANTTIFTLIDGVLLRPLPYPEASRLLTLWTSYAVSNGQPDVFSPPNYFDVAARSRTLEAVGAYDDMNFALAGAGQPENIPGERLTASMSRVLGVSPQLGRWFTAAEDESGDAVVMLSDAIWRNRFGADSEVLGRSVVMNGRSFLVVGVLPPHVGFPSISTHLYVPMRFSPDEKQGRGNVFLNVAARMRPGISLATAEAELRAIARGLAQEYPGTNAGIQMGAISLQETFVGNVKPMLLVLWAAVAFMLAVGCANVANLLLAHAAGRQREFAMRRSLGATNTRLIRQLLTESVTLAGVGGAIGLAMAAWAVPAMASRLPANFPHIRDVGLDARVLWFTFGISMLTGVVFGLLPAMGSVRRSLSQSLREGSAAAGSGMAHRRLGRVLVVGEVAVVLVLLIGAGLVLRSLARLSAVDPGFRTRGLIAWQIFLPPVRYPDVPAQRAFFRNVIDQVESLPGVQAAALVNPLPFGPVDIVSDTGFAIAGRPSAAPDQRPQALVTRISPTYFSTMGIPLRRGRAFDARDGATSQVVIISDALAARYFAGQDPVGQRLVLGRNHLEAEIVGVVGDVKHINLRSNVRPEFYLPLARFTVGSAGLLVRASGDANAILPAVERRVWTVDSSIPANLAAPVERLLYASLAPDRIATLLLAVFAGTTLLLGLVGVYGVLSYSVRRRTREIGIRLALGASTRGVLRMVLGEALGLSLAGVTAGLIAALVFSRYLNALLFGVTAVDTATYVVVSLSVPCAALLAAWYPAHRATQVDPSTSLRSE